MHIGTAQLSGMNIGLDQFDFTELKRYVCTTSTAGGDGTTSATAGANRAYATLEECMHANEQNLVTAKRFFNVEITGDCSTADTTAVTVHNYTTDATHYVNIYTTGNARHDGRAASVSGRSNYRLYGVGIYTSISYLTLDGIEVYGMTVGGTSQAVVGAEPGAYHGVIFKNLLVHDCYYRAVGIKFEPAYSDCAVFNCIVYNISDDYSRGIAELVGNSALCYNNTVYKCGGNSGNSYYDNGIQGFGTSNTAKNNISIGCKVDFSSGGDYNLSGDTTAPGANSIKSKSASNQFVSITVGAEDLRLKAGSDAINVGTNLGASYNTDIIGTSRPQGAAWDIGAFEYISSGTPAGFMSCMKGTW